MLSRILDVLNKYCHRKLLLYWLLCGWVFDEIAKCDHPFFLTKYKILSNNIWRYIQKSYTKGIILSEKYLFSTGGLGKKNKSGQTSKWMEIYAQVSTRIMVFNRIIFYATIWHERLFLKSIFRCTFIQRSFFFNDIGSNKSRCERDMLQIICYVHMCIKTRFSMLSNFKSGYIYTFVCYL